MLMQLDHWAGVLLPWAGAALVALVAAWVVAERVSGKPVEDDSEPYPGDWGA